jgi:flagellar export protein FliJ
VAALATRRALDAELASIDQEIEGLRAQIAAAHVEVRKFERLIELDEARQKLRRDKREHAEMDELAIQRAASK